MVKGNSQECFNCQLYRKQNNDNLTAAKQAEKHNACITQKTKESSINLKNNISVNKSRKSLVQPRQFLVHSLVGVCHVQEFHGCGEEAVPKPRRNSKQ